MKKLIKAKNTEFEQNGRTLAIIDTTQRGGKPIMIDADVLDEAIHNGDLDALESIQTDKILGPKEITDNGIYNPKDDGLDGYNNVTVEIPAGEIEEYFDIQMANGDSVCPGFARSVKKLPRFTFSGTNGGYLFSGYQGEEIDASGIDITNATDLRYMFYYNQKLKHIDLSHFIGKNVTYVYRMFYGDTKLETVDLRNFNPDNLTSLDYFMFSCVGLKLIDMRSFDFTKITSFYNSFSSMSGTCTLVVADETQREFLIANNLSDKFTIKTVAEYEAGL